MAHAALLAIGLGAGAYLARGERDQPTGTIALHGLIAGAIAGALLAALVVAMNTIDLRSIFISLSPQTSDMLTFELDQKSVLVVGLVIKNLFDLITGRDELPERRLLFIETNCPMKSRR